MFGARKKPPRSPQPGTQPKSGSKNLAQFGLMDMGDDGDLGEADDDLEDELNKLVFGGAKTKKPQKKKAPGPDLEAMVASCMKDIPSDGEDGDGDDDDDDPDLMDELAELGGSDDEEDQPVRKPSPVQGNSCATGTCAGEDMLSVIESRISMYSNAEQKAKASGDSAKARRFARGLATLTEQRKKVKSGKAVNQDDIPPPIAQPSAPSSQITSPVGPVPELLTPQVVAPQAPPRSAPLPPVPARAPPPPPSADPPPTIRVEVPQPAASLDPEAQKVIALLKQRREHYKESALAAKKEGDKTRAMAGLQGVKQCDLLLKAAADGQAVTLNDLPDLPSQAVQESTVQKSPNPVHPVLNRMFSRDDPIQIPENPEDIPPPDPALFGAPPPPNTIEEALQQRLAKYKEDESKAKQEGNSSRARRLGRICQQYEEAMRFHRAGKPIPIEDLPTPPGFGPIPIPQAGTPVASPPAKPAGQMSAQNSGSNISGGVKKPPASPQPNSGAGPATGGSPSDAVKPGRKSLSLQEKQLLLLEKRQQQFKEAALEAKRAGQIEQAKEYLRQTKGFDKLIEATKCGLPVDFNTVPVPPQDIKSVSTGFVIVSKEDCDPGVSLGSTDRQEMFAKLEKDLLEQLKMCDANRAHFKSTADVASSNKFQQMMEHTKKDLDALRFCFKRGDPVPKFHYEVRSFPRVVCNTDLTDNDLEFNIIQAINLPGPNPKEMQTYCKFEFPYPKETPFLGRTLLVKDTNNPEYNFKVNIPLNRKEKSCQRVFKRYSAKVEVWVKGGFLRSDILLGTAQVKLQPLETVCMIHDSYALMDGRKAIGGQVEVMIKIRNPIVSKQIEKVEEKWLVISF